MSDRAERRFELRAFHRNPEEVTGGDLRGTRNGSADVSKWALEVNAVGILRQRFGPHNQSDRGGDSGMRALRGEKELVADGQ